MRWTRGRAIHTLGHSVPLMPYPGWPAVARDLADALEDLQDRDFLVLGEPSPTALAHRSLAGQRHGQVAARYVQVLRVDDVLSAECVGATALGGTWTMDDATITRLTALGWLTPAESEAAYGHVSPNFELYVELLGAAELTALLVASLDLLGASPGALVLRSSSGGLRAATS